MKLSTACKSHDYRSIKIAKRGSKEGTCRVERNESSPLGISLVAVALDFQVFLAQTIRLKKSNSKEPERSRCCRGGK